MVLLLKRPILVKVSPFKEFKVTGIKFVPQAAKKVMLLTG